MGVKKGQYFSLSYDGVNLGKITDLSLNIDGNQIPASNFDSGDFEEFLRGRNNVQMEVTCQYDQNDTTGQGNLVDDALAVTSAAVVFGPASLVSDDITYSGTGSASNVNISATDEEVAEISFSLQISGTLTKATTA